MRYRLDQGRRPVHSSSSRTFLVSNNFSLFEILFRVDIVCLCWTVAEIGNEQKTETISIGSRSTGKDYKIVCYYTNWSQYRPKIGKYLPEDVEADLCTHIIFAFGWLKKGKLSSLESNDETKDGKVGLYERINAFKKINPRLKVLLAIGKRPRHGSSPTTGRPADEIAHLDLPQVAGRSARPSSRRCRPRATLARRSSSAPSRSSGSTTLTDSTSTGNTPRAPTTSATLSSSSKVPDPINRSKSTITAHVSTLETSNSNNGRCFSIPTQISLLKDHPKRVARPKLDRLGFCFCFFFCRTARSVRGRGAGAEDPAPVADGGRARRSGQHQRRLRRTGRGQPTRFHQPDGLRFPRQMGEPGRSQRPPLRALLRQVPTTKNRITIPFPTTKSVASK